MGGLQDFFPNRQGFLVVGQGLFVAAHAPNTSIRYCHRSRQRRMGGLQDFFSDRQGFLVVFQGLFVATHPPEYVTSDIVVGESPDQDGWPPRLLLRSPRLFAGTPRPLRSDPSSNKSIRYCCRISPEKDAWPPRLLLESPRLFADTPRPGRSGSYSNTYFRYCCRKSPDKDASPPRLLH